MWSIVLGKKRSKWSPERFLNIHGLLEVLQCEQGWDSCQFYCKVVCCSKKPSLKAGEMLIALEWLQCQPLHIAQQWDYQLLHLSLWKSHWIHLCFKRPDHKYQCLGQSQCIISLSCPSASKGLVGNGSGGNFSPSAPGKKCRSCQGIGKKEWEVAEWTGKGWFMCSIISPPLAIVVF